MTEIVSTSESMQDEETAKAISDLTSESGRRDRPVLAGFHDALVALTGIAVDAGLEDRLLSPGCPVHPFAFTVRAASDPETILWQHTFQIRQPAPMSPDEDVRYRMIRGTYFGVAKWVVSTIKVAPDATLIVTGSIAGSEPCPLEISVEDIKGKEDCDAIR